MAVKDEFGRAGEERAVRHLRDSGYTVIDRNWRCPQGEIDVVAVAGAHLIVVEVKARRTELFGHPLEAVDSRKAARLWRLAVAWIGEHRDLARGRRLRVDVISIVGDDPALGALEHLEDAL